MSVATSTRISPDLKSASAEYAHLAIYYRGSPHYGCHLYKLFSQMVSAMFGTGKHQHLRQFPFPIICDSNSRLRFLSTSERAGSPDQTQYCGVPLRFPRVVQQFFRQGFNIVREGRGDNRFWRFAGSFVNTRRISWISPCRACGQLHQGQEFPPDPAHCILMFQVQQTSRRCHQHITPPRSFIICGLMLTPPNTTSNECSGICCNHGRFRQSAPPVTGRGKNERTHRTTPFGVRLGVIRCCNSGSVKPAVLPVPVGRWPSGRGLPAPQGSPAAE